MRCDACNCVLVEGSIIETGWISHRGGMHFEYENFCSMECLKKGKVQFTRKEFLSPLNKPVPGQPRQKVDDHHRTNEDE